MTTETTASADALLPCDWCGEVPTGCDVRGPEDEVYYAIECRSKKCRDASRFCGALGDDEEDARAAWNERTNTAANASEGSAAAFDGVALSEAVLDVLVYDIGQFGTILSKMSEDDRVDLREGIALAVQRALAAPHAVEPTEAVTEAIPMLAAQRLAFLGLAEWQSKPHNARWWKRIDGTPIPNDLPICIAEVFADAEMVAHEVERARQSPKDAVSAPRDTDCEAIRAKRIGVLARAEDGSAAMTMVLRDPDAPRDFDPGTVIATLTLGDGRTASDRVTASWAAQVLRELGGAR